jgi:hypothetical protein
LWVLKEGISYVDEAVVLVVVESLLSHEGALEATDEVVKA